MKLFGMLRETRTLLFLKAVLAEFLGTAIVVFLGLAAIITWIPPAFQPDTLTGTMPIHASTHQASTTSHAAQGASLGLLGVRPTTALTGPEVVPIALAFGIALVVVSFCVSPLSGGHLNPAVTVAMAATTRIRPTWALGYVLSQLLGAIAASAALYGLTPGQVHKDLGINKLSPGVTQLQALAIEAGTSFQLVLCVFATSNSKREPPKSRHLIIGLSLILGHLVAVRYTGCGMNPARSLGPAVITSVFTHHWVYWAGPICGGLTAAFTYDVILVPKWKSLRDWLRTLRKGQEEGDDAQQSTEKGQEIGLK
ncbi:aquaporin-5-like [Microcaecilia unicolor]|uniref:Aquaporin-5-like n=1 Tax=Microcaecilia unicolor TaxID=1415580 RepID=A0A6P7ZQ89_9AMPH|nr:aquaporin-5-like [Microcaecilia unicolor]